MPQNATQSWPQTTDGVTDWETVFEDPEKGLIPLIAQAHTPQALRDCAVVTINMLFTRDSDAGDIAKLTAELHELAPDDADEARTGQIRGVISLLLRQIKEDRIESAREFLEKKKQEAEATGAAEAGDGQPPAQAGTALSGGPASATATARPNRRTARKQRKPSLKQRRAETAPWVSWAVAAALIGAIGLGGWVYLKGDNGDNTAAQVWVKLAAGTVSKQLPNKAWSITSVKKGDDETIVVEILITDKTHVNQIKSIRRIHRIDFLKTICPVKGPGIIRMTEAGWSLWLNLNSETGKLTGGTCKY